LTIDKRCNIEKELAINEIGSKVGYEGAVMMSEGLKFNSTLTKLNISGSNIGDEGVEMICEALKINSTLTALDFDFLVGADAVFAFKLGGGIALTAGLDVATNAVGYGLWWLAGDSIAESDGATFSYEASGFTVKPRVGISWGL